MTTIYVARHGETDYVKNGVLMGSMDIPLNETGKEQMTVLVNDLKSKGIEFDFIISSPLIRAIESSKIVADYFQKEITVDNNFKERGAGEDEGTPLIEITKRQESYKDDLQRMFEETPKGGEKPFEVEQRVFNALDNIKDKYPDKTILVITHSYILKMINKYCKPDISLEEFFNFNTKNGELVKFDL
ncbi:MAG: histidine phosphatase family protein [Candidatus Magasanikbacteria bacterium]